jgi:GTP-binding protein
MKSRRFVDTVNVHIRAGNGGNGCVSFRREKFVPHGGPDGGDGGRGGNVILVGDHDEDSLVRLYFTPEQRAEDGGHGKGSQLHGRNGKDLVIQVPCGTEIHDPRTGIRLGDITKHGQQMILARGGKGGLGNCHWKSSTHQAPREHTDGEAGEEFDVRMELKLLADAGLVGYPNAGKSSVLSRISDAHPRIAAYPFTTLNPIIGTLLFDDYTRIRVADIPGLIDGAHAGRGLGHEFLRHVERSQVLIYVIDMAGMDGRKPYEDYRNLRNELKLHNKELARRPSIIVANKMDLPEAVENLKAFKSKTRTKPLKVSTLSGDGLDELKEAIRQATVPASPA